jgi:hypothetical protein
MGRETKKWYAFALLCILLGSGSGFELESGSGLYYIRLEKKAYVT